MIFNSFTFLVFFVIFFITYWLINNYRSINIRNIFIIFASYTFYGWWDWRFLSLIIISSIADYTIGLQIAKTPGKSQRKKLLLLSLIVNLGLLGFFKYYNFFIDSFTDLLSLFSYSVNTRTLNIILPVGISFYTFQTLSYTIDVYKEKIEPTRDVLSFFAFVSFFPQLVAGPIERAKNLLPQFYLKKSFDYTKATDGMRQILWGFFKKVVIADNCGEVVDYIFSNSSNLPGSTLLIGTILFSFQIYGDFSGYSDIAIGISRLLGFDLMKNFAFPYFSRDIAEFWRRWHISLTSWFRDYLYIPLGGSKVSKSKTIRNIFIIFLVSGLWHGANWTFLAWGAVNALLFIPLLLFGTNRKHIDIVAKGKKLPGLNDILMIILTFSITSLAWIFFRSESISEAFEYFSGIFSGTIINIPGEELLKDATVPIIMILFMILIEWLGREGDHALAEISFLKKKRYLNWTFYIVILFLIGMFMHVGGTPFIYFQF